MPDTTAVPYARFPHVTGDQVAFVADDDVWLVGLDGGRATRLTSDRVRVAAPRLSPDGTQVAWTTWLHGSPEVQVCDVDGGSPRRLTWWGAEKTLTRGWTPDGRVLAVGETGQASTVRTFAHALPTDGSPGERLPYGWVDDVAFGPAGQVLVSTAAGHSRDAAWWKRYRGGTAARLWLDRDGSGDFERLLPGHTASLVHPLWVGDRVLVVSDHEGTGALQLLDEDLAGLREVVRHDHYVRHASTDGTTIVYAAGGDLYALDAQQALGAEPRPRRLDVRLPGVRAGRQARLLAVGDHRGDVAVDHTGRASAVEARGSVHWVTHRDGPARPLVAVPGVRARIPAVVGDRVVVVSDVEGDDTLQVVEPTGVVTRLATGPLGRVLEAAASPDGSRLAVASHDGRLLLVGLPADPAAPDADPVDVPVAELTRADEGEVNGLAWSPDSAWLAWSHPAEGGDLRQIRLARADDQQVVDATPVRFTDTEPTFTRDGLHLAFLSVRSLDPVYDAYAFDLSFPGGCRPHLLPLAARTPSPFAAEAGGRPVTREDSSPHDEVPVTTVDVEGLEQRVVPVPVPAARYERLTAVEGGLAWLRVPPAGELGDDRARLEDDRPRPVLERYDLGVRRLEVLRDEVDGAWFSGDGRRVVVADGSALRVLPTDHRLPEGDDGDKDRVDVDLDRVRLHLDPGAEWRQMFDEAGRLMRDNYWRPDLGGTDWAGVLARYRPLVDRVGSLDDLIDLLWEVQGELGTSHAYVFPPADEDDRPGQGFLGADLARDTGGWRVERVLPGDSSEPRARSPLTAPGVAVATGDRLVAVDGQPVPDAGPGALLAGTAGVPVELTVERDGETRRVVVTPTADEKPLRYQDWVAGRREAVRTLSQGRLGYLHVPDMMSPGWAQLHRDLRTEMAREGLVVDLRENRGGHTSQLVVAMLARRVVGWNLPRGYSPKPYPADGPRGPVVAVVDEWAGSDGDIVTAAIQALDIGPVVGMRTWGGVVGIDGKYHLVDGTLVTQPRYAFWLEGPGWAVENHGVDPDVELEHSPRHRTTGADPQLEESVRLALDALGRTPAAAPPDRPGVQD